MNIKRDVEREKREGNGYRDIHGYGDGYVFKDKGKYEGGGLV